MSLGVKISTDLIIACIKHCKLNYEETVSWQNVFFSVSFNRMMLNFGKFLNLFGTILYVLGCYVFQRIMKQNVRLLTNTLKHCKN